MVPIEVDATTCPFAFVESIAFARLENQTEPRVVSEEEDWLRFTMLEKVVEALKKLLPEKVLLLERRVEDAAVSVPVMLGVKSRPFADATIV